VAVVAAGVHHARVAAGVGQAGGFNNGQGVHVGAQAQAFGPRAALQLAHHAGAAQAACDAVAPLGQAFGDQLAGAELLETQLGVAVDVAPHAGEFIGVRLQGVQFGEGAVFQNGGHGAGLVYCACRLMDFAMAW
jgi:hypothetical protein